MPIAAKGFNSKLVSFLIFPALLCAQAPDPPKPAPTSAEVTTKDAPLAFKSGINLVPVTVVVRDARGKAIGTLGRDDFQLSDNGKPQMISRFTLEKLSGAAGATTPSTHESTPTAGTTTAPAATPTDGIPDRFVAYLFDDMHMTPQDLNDTKKAAGRQIDSSSANPLERTAIYAISGEPQQEFTGDRDKLHAALAALGTSHNTFAKMQHNTCPEMTYYMGNQIYAQNDSKALSIAANDALICAHLDKEYDTAVRMAQAAARDADLLGDKNSESSLEALRNVVARMASMPGQRTIVLVSPGFLVLDNRRDEEMALIERAIKANVVIAALDARGLYALTPGGDASQPDVNSKSVLGRLSYTTTENMMQSDALAIISSGTGGALYEGTNDYDEGFARTAATPEYLYVLGFSPLDLKLDGKYHNLKVTLKGVTGMTLQVRKGYYAPTHATNPADQAKEAIEEAFFSRDEIRDLPAVLQTQYFKADNGDVRLSATAEVDIKKLGFHKEGDRNRNDITVVTGLFDGDGNYVSGAQKIVEMRLLDDTLAKRTGPGIAVKSSFAVHSGRYVVRMVVRDSEGQLMSAQSKLVEIP